MKLFIKYMFSTRSKMLVKAELEKLGLHYTTIETGEVNINGTISEKQLKVLNLVLKKSGLELLDDGQSAVIENIKTAIVELIHYSNRPLKINFPDYLAAKLHQEYTHLSQLFSEVEGITIEQYIINQKIERVKELILYDELELTEIANKLHYTKVAHLTREFKRVTGLSPTHFRKLRKERLKTLKAL